MISDNNDSADLHPEHTRQFIIVAVVLWTVAHLIMLIRFSITLDYSLLFIIIPAMAVNIWVIIRIIKFYKNK